MSASKLMGKDIPLVDLAKALIVASTLSNRLAKFHKLVQEQKLLLLASEWKEALAKRILLRLKTFKYLRQQMEILSNNLEP